MAETCEPQRSTGCTYFLSVLVVHVSSLLLPFASYVGLFLMTTTNVDIAFNRVFSVNTFARISNVPRESVQSE